MEKKLQITGRDNQIICQALKIAIPIMQSHSLSSSNLSDMERIFEHLSSNTYIDFPDIKVKAFVEQNSINLDHSPTGAL